MLVFQITDLAGTPLTTITDHKGGDVTIPVSDSRLATLTLGLDHDALAHVKPLSRMLKVRYNGHLVFWGVLLKPSWTSSDGQRDVKLNAHDQTIWWKKNYHRYGDVAVDYGYPIDGRGVFWLAESAIPLPNQQVRGIPGPGIKWSSATDLTAHTGPRPADLNKPAPGDGKWALATRGQQVYESIQNVSQDVTGPEWNLRPIDADSPGIALGWEAGYYAELACYGTRGVDRSGQIMFVRGGAGNNLSSFIWEPDGDQVRNYAVTVYPGGERSRDDAIHRALAHSEASWLKYGIYETWQSSNNKDPLNILQAKSDAWVQAYSEPPDYFTIAPLAERGTPDVAAEDVYRYIDHFTEGDTIRAVCQDGGMVCDLKGRIMQVTLRSDAKGKTTTALDCVPNVGGALGAGDEGG